MPIIKIKAVINHAHSKDAIASLIHAGIPALDCWNFNSALV
jgi:hypothetical protein